MPDNLLYSGHNLTPVWKQKLRRAVRQIQVWFRHLIYSLIEIIILFVATGVLVGIILSFLEAFWYLYLQTPVGIKYTADPSISGAHLITQLFKKDLFVFALEITTSSMAACLVMSAACQVLAVRRYFYAGRGLLSRVVWLLLFSAAAAFGLMRTGQIDPSVAFGISMVPSLCLFTSCLNIAARLLPELTPFGIMEMIISLKNFILHSRDRVTEDPLASLFPAGPGELQAAAVQTPAPSAKTRGKSPVKPDVSATAR